MRDIYTLQSISSSLDKVSDPLLLVEPKNIKYCINKVIPREFTDRLNNTEYSNKRKYKEYVSKF